MDAKKHPDYSEEKNNLQETVEWIEKEGQFLGEWEGKLKREINEIRKTVMHLQDERLIAKQQLYHIAERNKKNLEFAKNTPYFGRVDFQENHRDGIEKIYIGKHGLHDQEKEIPIVVDWRAPIADIYYNGHSKEVSYKAPNGEVKGKMFLKRRYEIQNGELKKIIDEKTSEDIIEDSLKGKGNFLLEALKKSTQGRLKEIVATIQDQQNKIIRSDLLKPLIVQGVAGSGKTTIALHRMAYVIYNQRRNIEDARYMVIAPNKLFLDYISDILPDLGVDDVIQTTFEDWALQLIPPNISISNEIREMNPSRLAALSAKIKGSLLFKKVMDRFINKCEISLLPKKDLCVNGMVLMEYDKIQQIFMTSNLHLSIDERLKKMRHYLKTKFKSNFGDIREKIEAYYDEQLKILKENTIDIESIRQEIVQLYDERDNRIEKIEKDLSSIVDDYMDEAQKLEVEELYSYIFEEKEELTKAFQNKIKDGKFFDVWGYMYQNIKNHKFQNEDLAPMAYISMKLFGCKDNKKYAHIVVDEAQDLNELEMSILRELSMNDSFTFVGDLSQGVYSYRGIYSWTRAMQRVFGGKSYQYHTLTTSYRSTIEIMNLANEVLKRCKGLEIVLAEPVFRHGVKPQLKKCCHEEEMVKAIVHQIELLNQEGYHSIAIICKNGTCTEEVYSKLKKHIPSLHLLTDEETKFKEGMVVISAYLAKGLEFDGVLIWNADENTYSMVSIDVKLLYIAVTRALHRVYIYYKGNLSPVLEGLEFLLDPSLKEK